jgi:hypothetical protein
METKSGSGLTVKTRTLSGLDAGAIDREADAGRSLSVDGWGDGHTTANTRPRGRVFALSRAEKSGLAPLVEQIGSQGDLTPQVG